MCVYGYNNLSVCLSILRHGLHRATSFSKEANEAESCYMGSLGNSLRLLLRKIHLPHEGGKSLAVGLSIDKVIE